MFPTYHLRALSKGTHLVTPHGIFPNVDKSVPASKTGPLAVELRAGVQDLGFRELSSGNCPCKELIEIGAQTDAKLKPKSSELTNCATEAV